MKVSAGALFLYSDLKMDSSGQSSGIEKAVETSLELFHFTSLTLFEFGVSLDASSTFRFMRDFGISMEENPLVRYLAENMGILPGLATHVGVCVAGGTGFYFLCKYFGKTIKESLERLTQKQSDLNPNCFGSAGLLYLGAIKLSCGIENMQLYL